MKPLKRPPKEKELKLFERVNELLELSATKVEQPKPPNPDIFAIINDKCVGVEISELYSDNLNRTNGSRLARNQSIREKTIELAIRKVEKTIKFPFELHVSYDRNEILDKDIIPLAEEIARIVTEQLQNVIPTEDWNILKVDISNYEYNLSRISIYVSNKLSRHYYSPIAAGQIPHLSQQNIEAAISLKEPKIENYRKHCDEIWLLLVELGGIASAFDNVSEALLSIYTSKFDRIYLLRSLDREILEIKTSG